MLLRLWFCVLAAGLGASAGMAADPAPAPRGLTVTHFPPAAYVDEPVTFAGTGVPGLPLTLTLDQRRLATVRLVGDTFEVTVPLPAAGTLCLTQGATTHRFLLVRPGEPVAWRADQGRLYRDQDPVILLLPHRHPPRQDRTWQAAKTLAALLGPDPRPLVKSVAVLGAPFLAADAPATLAARGWTWYPTDDSHGDWAPLLAALPTLKPAAALLVAPGSADLEQGASLLSYRQRLEWLLQSVDRQRFPQVFVVAPPLDRFGRERFPELVGHLRLAAAAHQAKLLLPAADPGRAPLAATAWLPLILPGLAAEVRLP